MRNRLLTMGAALGVLALTAAGAHAQSWASADTAAAGRSLAAAARYAESAMSGAGRAAEADIAGGLKGAESFGEHLAHQTATGTEQAWARASDAASRAIEKLRKVVVG